MSTRTGLANPDDVPSSFVNVPWRTNFAELAVLVVLEAVLLIEGAGDARGALPLGMALFLALILGDGGELNLSLVACLSWVDLVPLGDPGILLATAGGGGSGVFSDQFSLSFCSHSPHFIHTSGLIPVT